MTRRTFDVGCGLDENPAGRGGRCRGPITQIDPAKFVVDRETAEQCAVRQSFEWIEAWYDPRRRHTSLGMLPPHEFEALHTAERLQSRSRPSSSRR